MIKGMIVSALVFLGFQASAMPIESIQSINTEIQKATVADARVMGIDWVVGETASYNMQGFMAGTMEMTVREEVKEGFWINQNIDAGFMGQNKVESLIDRNTGEVLRVIVNGQEQDPPAAPNQEIEEMKEDNITVPAGTFDVVYLRIKDLDKNQTQEAWLNPSEIPVSGMVKTVAPSNFGPITLELTGFSFPN